MRRQPTTNSTHVLHALVAALPDDRLRPLLLELLTVGSIAIAPAPVIADPVRQRDPRLRGGAPMRRARSAKPSRRGWPKGKPRGRQAVDPDVEGKRLARNEAAKLWARRKRAAAKAATTADHGHADNGNGAKPAIATTVTPAVQLWEHAERLHPKRPWVPVVEEFGLNSAATLDCYRTRSLPPGLPSNAIEKFLALPAP